MNSLGLAQCHCSVQYINASFLGSNPHVAWETNCVFLSKNLGRALLKIEEIGYGRIIPNIDFSKCKISFTMRCGLATCTLQWRHCNLRFWRYVSPCRRFRDLTDPYFTVMTGEKCQVSPLQMESRHSGLGLGWARIIQDRSAASDGAHECSVQWQLELASGHRTSWWRGTGWLIGEIGCFGQSQTRLLDG